MRVGTFVTGRARNGLRMAAVLGVIVGSQLLGMQPAEVAAGDQCKCRSPVIPPTGFMETVYEYLALDWAQWYIETPAAVNPVLDETGENAAQGQNPWSPFFFLAGNSGGETTRTTTVPRGKFLFFPVLTYVGWAPVDGATEEEVRATANFFMDIVTDLECTIDGVPVENLWTYRVESPCGSFGPNDMAYGDPTADPPIPDAYGGGDILLADGYWVLVCPLRPGEHVINFSGALGMDGETWFALDVTYLITVEGRRPCHGHDGGHQGCDD